MHVELKSTSNKRYERFVGQKGEFLFQEYKVFFKLKNEKGFRTSLIKSIDVEDSTLKVTTTNNEYVFEKISE